MTKASYHVLIGTKAQLVKMAPIIKELTKQKVNFEFILTGQHQETMNDLITCFGITPPTKILFKEFESNSSMKLLRWLFSCSKALFIAREEFKSSAGIIVHGDTLSTLVGSVFGKLLGIKVIHIEGGLRSYNLFRPFPEELIRIAVTKMANVLYCPTKWAYENISTLKKKKSLVINTEYNTLLDSLRLALENVSHHQSEPYIVVSIHRVESVMNKESLIHITNLLKSINSIVPVKFVLHSVTKKQLVKFELIDELVSNNVTLLPRMDYTSFIRLICHSSGLITDGGSNQEEAAYMGIPCLIFRKETERQEGLGQNVILSNLEYSTAIDFATNAINKKWQLNELPPCFPSKTIVESLKCLQ